MTLNLFRYLLYYYNLSYDSHRTLKKCIGMTYSIYIFFKFHSIMNNRYRQASMTIAWISNMVWGFGRSLALSYWQRCAASDLALRRDATSILLIKLLSILNIFPVFFTIYSKNIISQILYFFTLRVETLEVFIFI